MSESLRQSQVSESDTDVLHQHIDNVVETHKLTRLRNIYLTIASLFLVIAVVLIALAASASMSANALQLDIQGCIFQYDSQKQLYQRTLTHKIVNISNFDLLNFQLSKDLPVLPAVANNKPFIQNLDLSGNPNFSVLSYVYLPDTTNFTFKGVNSFMVADSWLGVLDIAA